ncbi:MATE family efflux transporter [Canibacter sp. lx-72]|nr:MATE family efflux transporter [Canibacter zhuwentaonis]
MLSSRVLNREILRLTLPALGTLVAEPLFRILDTAMVGHLGADILAGLGVGSTILTTAVALMIFLAYATTPAVARYVGAGRMGEAIQAGISGIYLAALIGVLIALLLALIPGLLVGFFLDGQSLAGRSAHTYLIISSAGVPAILITFAASGLVRGLQDTLTPLLISGAGFACNAVLNAIFIYGLGWGIAGSATGTVIAEWGMAAALVWHINKKARATGASWRPSLRGIKASGIGGSWLLLRTLTLRVCTVLAVVAATQHSTQAAAGFQIINSVFMLLAFIFDSLAIACQALIGKTLGASDKVLTQKIVRRVALWGVYSGIIAGVLVALGANFLGAIFTADQAVLVILPQAFITLAILQPLCAIVFIYDGVLIGAGDNKYLGLAGIFNLCCYSPAFALLVYNLQLDAGYYLSFNILAIMGVYMVSRLATLGLRVRSEKWLKFGIVR